MAAKAFLRRSRVEFACLESSGDISVVTFDGQQTRGGHGDRARDAARPPACSLRLLFRHDFRNSIGLFRIAMKRGRFTCIQRSGLCRPSCSGLTSS